MSRGRRITGWIVRLGLIVAVLGFVYTQIVRLAERGPELELNQVLLPVLAIVLVFVGLALAGIIIRNLVKLVVERKRGILGAQLRSKLVFYFLALVLLPAVVLFVGSSQLIKRTVEGMLRTPVEDITNQSQRMVDAWNALQKESVLAGLERVRDDTLERYGADLSVMPTEWLSARRYREGLDWVALLSGSAVVSLVEPEDADPARSDALRSQVAALAETDGTISLVEHLDPLLAVHGIVQLSQEGGAWRLAGGRFVSVEMVQRMEAISAGRTGFQRFRVQRKELLRLYLYLIALIFMVTVYAASWMGFYLSRRITVPIRELSSAAREISMGNLGVRVDAKVGDELGTLVDAFNEMAAELQENREVITRSTADLRRSNQALDERRRYIETLLAQLSTAVVSLDQEGRITTANPAVREVLGLQVEIGQPLLPALERAALTPLASLLESAMRESREGVRRDLELDLPSGVVHASIQVSPLHGSAGETLGTLVMIEDLSDLLRAQRTAAWTEVARRIAHEIKNPLTPIQLAAQRLRKKFVERREDLDEVLPEATESIVREVNALKRLVDEFSRFARMPEIRVARVAFDEVVESVLGLFQGVSGVSWDVAVAEDLGPVRVDPEQIRRAMINLIDNSITAMKGKGRVRISASRWDGPGSLRLEIADSGPGIPKENRDRMFVPYFSTKRSGSGLGLAIVHRIVSDHGGQIRVEENAPSGARFVIEIPG